ncbi:hypothetical protein [Pseudomonas amygdali]|uniref:Uncharacterized protein n=1 Tax=Pseudomonas amygdali pv. tabaci TaxID=322 RepID=A0AAX1VXZ4_PSEAJ|nr:hypothetical protein [Pseudomonas amygdali]RML82367.1 hypothetical protein ALQ89_03215 [Pseudomonas amygdali pv. tabaci]
MTGKRVHVIQYDKDNKHPDGYVSEVEWLIQLPEKIQDDDALRILYIFEYKENGDAELYSVVGWDRRLLTRAMGNKIEWILRMGSTVGLAKDIAKSLMDTYRPGTDLTDTQVQNLDASLSRGWKPPESFDLDGVLRKAMSLEDAKLAVSKFYHVKPEQVQVNITG